MERNIALSKRLKAIADEVNNASGVADIGTDHAHIPIYLIQKKKADYVYACDINEGPLAKAKENIALYNLEDKIECRLSDGLDNIRKSEIDTLIIAGMGGELIIDILSRGKHLRSDIKQYILSPHSKKKELRENLRSSGFVIKSEKMIKDTSKYYNIMNVEYDEIRSKTEYSKEIYDTFSYHLIKSKDAILLEYLKKEELKYQNILSSIRSSESDSCEIEEKLKLIKEALYEMR